MEKDGHEKSGFQTDFHPNKKITLKSLSPDMMAYRMRTEIKDGEFYFEPHEYLLPSQINGMVTRLMHKEKNTAAKRVTQTEEDGLGDDINDLIDIFDI